MRTLFAFTKNYIVKRQKVCAGYDGYFQKRFICKTST